MVILAEGLLDLPAAGSFRDPGFHEVLTASWQLPSSLAGTAGSRLSITLGDAGRPEMECTSQHPLSGCATVDWSDALGRPGVPPEGVFDNHLTLSTTSGEVILFLSESGALNDAPDLFSPG